MREAKRRVSKLFEKLSECSSFDDDAASVDVDGGEPTVTAVIDPNVSDCYQISVPCCRAVNFSFSPGVRFSW